MLQYKIDICGAACGERDDDAIVRLFASEWRRGEIEPYLRAPRVRSRRFVRRGEIEPYLRAPRVRSRRFVPW